jgi:predicted  nucleic acid-binding Zn-ribbon protein
VKERGIRLKEQLALLIELQKMESAAGRIAARSKELPLRIGELDAAFGTLSTAMEAEQGRLDALKQAKKEKDSLLQKGQELLKRPRERLLEVKTNKEYQSVLKEIETIEAKNSHVEDEIIALLDEIDRVESDVKVKRGGLDSERRRYDTEKSALETELNSLGQELEDCQRKTDAVKKKISADMLRRYQQIKSAGRAVAVAAVWKEVCDGCHMSIPPQLYNELQKSDQLMTCPHCCRIIYWENRNG